MNPNDPEFQEFQERVRRELFPMVMGSLAFVSVTPRTAEQVDVKFAVELGLAIMLDKPIIAIMRPGTKISEKFARVADRFVEMDEHPDEAFTERFQAAVAEVEGVVEAGETLRERSGQHVLELELENAKLRAAIRGCVDHLEDGGEPSTVRSWLKTALGEEWQR